MDIQDTVWYRLWIAFMAAIGVCFGFDPMSPDSRTVCEGVRAFNTKEGALMYVLVLRKKQDMRSVVALLNDKMEHSFLREGMTLQVLGKVVFLRMFRRSPPHPSLMFSEQGLELFIPSSFFTRPSDEEACATEAYWDAFAKEIFLALN